jgi:N12 class adenine-specific DNA methylase
MDVYTQQAHGNIRDIISAASDEIAASGSNWKGFLETSSRLYKYKYPDQVSIYAQRPDATACASYDIWNSPGVNRFIKKGSKGIALFDEATGRKRYVFDVSDTEASFNNPNKDEPQRWQYNDATHKNAVNKKFLEAYGGLIVATGENSALENNIDSIADYLALGGIEGATGINRDEQDKTVNFVASSIYYAVLQRCGLFPDMSENDFDFISEISRDEMPIIGNVAANAVKEILNNIEMAIKQENRLRKSAERGNENGAESAIRGRGGRAFIPNTERPGTAPDRDMGARGNDVPDDAPLVAGGADENSGNMERLSGGSERNVRGANGNDDERTFGNIPSPGQIGSNGVGRAHEQPSVSGRINDSPGTDIHGEVKNATEREEEPAPTVDETYGGRAVVFDYERINENSPEIAQAPEDFSSLLGLPGNYADYTKKLIAVERQVSAHKRFVEEMSKYLPLEIDLSPEHINARETYFSNNTIDTVLKTFANEDMNKTLKRVFKKFADDANFSASDTLTIIKYIHGADVPAASLPADFDINDLPLPANLNEAANGGRNKIVPIPSKDRTGEMDRISVTVENETMRFARLSDAQETTAISFKWPNVAHTLRDMIEANQYINDRARQNGRQKTLFDDNNGEEAPLLATNNNIENFPDAASEIAPDGDKQLIDRRTYEENQAAKKTDTAETGDGGKQFGFEINQPVIWKSSAGMYEIQIPAKVKHFTARMVVVEAYNGITDKFYESRVSPSKIIERSFFDENLDTPRSLFDDNATVKKTSVETLNEEIEEMMAIGISPEHSEQADTAPAPDPEEEYTDGRTFYRTVNGREYKAGDKVFLVGSNTFDPTIEYQIEEIRDREMAFRDTSRPESNTRFMHVLMFDRLASDEPGVKITRTPQISPNHDERGMPLKRDSELNAEHAAAQDDEGRTEPIVGEEAEDASPKKERPKDLEAAAGGNIRISRHTINVLDDNGKLVSMLRDFDIYEDYQKQPRRLYELAQRNKNSGMPHDVFMNIASALVYKDDKPYLLVDDGALRREREFDSGKAAARELYYQNLQEYGIEILHFANIETSVLYGQLSLNIPQKFFDAVNYVDPYSPTVNTSRENKSSEENDSVVLDKEHVVKMTDEDTKNETFQEIIQGYSVERYEEQADIQSRYENKRIIEWPDGEKAVMWIGRDYLTFEETDMGETPQKTTTQVSTFDWETARILSSQLDENSEFGIFIKEEIEKHERAEDSVTIHDINSLEADPTPKYREETSDSITRSTPYSDSGGNTVITSPVSIDKRNIPPYAERDMVYLEDNRAFKISEISDNNVMLLDVELTDKNEFPVSRSMNQNDFERELANNPKNYPKIILNNFKIEDDNFGAEGGAKTRFRNNAEAIRTLKAIESENRIATPQEQQVLSKYVGWGGIPNAFDENKPDWANEYKELKGLLDENEYNSARKTTLYAHYTSPVVIRNIHQTLNRMGFNKGNVLEPSMGIGNFFGAMPQSMQNSKLYGVELDSITGRIAKQLYQEADIQIKGFEKTDFPDNFFDVAVGNVPFGDFQVVDKKYQKENFRIHDYFFAKTLDKVRPGGVVAFVTSKGTMDKKNSKVREYLSERAELLGAVRLPNNAFEKNAGTSVTTDILFLQKLETPRVNEPEWLNVNRDEKGVLMNEYFINHPEMILGEMIQEMSMYGNPDETTCKPFEGESLDLLLNSALGKIEGNIAGWAEEDKTLEDATDTTPPRETIPADPRVKNFSFTVINDEVYYRENSIMYKPVFSNRSAANDKSGDSGETKNRRTKNNDSKIKPEERIKGMVGLRDSVRELLDYQLADYSDAQIKEKQILLEQEYDSFTEKYGLINDKENAKAFSADSAYYLLTSLEHLDTENKLERKADIFTKRTISKNIPIEKAETSRDALAVSISEKAGVDIEFMAKLTGFDEGKITSDLQGAIFINPEKPTDENGRDRYETADEYLSGNVRKKLAKAEDAAMNEPEKYKLNVSALLENQPKDLKASDIGVRIGAAWIKPDYIKAFTCDLLDLSYNTKRDLVVEYAPINSSWSVKAPLNGRESNNPKVHRIYGTTQKNAFKLIENSLNLRDTVIKETKDDGKGGTIEVVNAKETALAQQRQEAIRQEFKNWIFRDPERRDALEKTYNEVFNSDKPRSYDGSHINFIGKNPEISLMKHQQDAIARVLYGGNTLLAHEVGAGKTFEMIASAMESKRIGLSKKNMFVVPNHLTEQTASEFMRLYPQADVLVATSKDFSKENRKKFCGRIATGDYDAIIIGQTQFERISISRERQEKYIREQISDITDAIDEMKKEKSGKNYTVKQLEKTKLKIEQSLEELLDKPKDDVVTFEELGVDKLYMDEAHAYKNLFLYTKMQNVAGIPQSKSQRATDMYLKAQYLDETTNGKGLVFATGTPVSNSMTEMYTMMRYLQRDTLKEKEMEQFDAWASNFGETQTAVELAPEGTGFRAKTRFSKFYNLPELLTTFAEIADIKTADSLNLKRPNAEYITVAVSPSPEQAELIKTLSGRADAVRQRRVKPTEDNMLKITTDGRKIGLDQRLMDEGLPDFEGSKVNKCVDTVLKIWEDAKADQGTQLLFCDYSTPTGSKTNDKFNVYDDVKKKLIGKGVPENEIAFIHDAKDEKEKKELFAKVRSGKVRILLGSTEKMGTGTNVQDRLNAIHHLDCPWRPSDLEQRDGRGKRQGNKNENIQIFKYVTEKTFDAYLYQTLENKQKFIGQIMTSKNPARTCDDIDGKELSFAEVKSLCAGDERIREKMQLDIEVTKLRMRKSGYESNRYGLEDDVRKHYPKAIEEARKKQDSFKKDIEHIKENSQEDNKEKFSPMTLGVNTFTKKEEAGKELLEYMKAAGFEKEINIGTYRGMGMMVYFDILANSFVMEMRREKNAVPHKVYLGSDEIGNITRINNEINRIPDKFENNKRVELETIKNLELAREELEKPFPEEAILETKSARLAELDIELNLDKTFTEQVNGADENKEKEMTEKEETQGGEEGDKITKMRWEQEVKNMPFIENGAIITSNPSAFSGIYRNIECVHKTDEYSVVRMKENELLIMDNKKMSNKMYKGGMFGFGIKSDTGTMVLVREAQKQENTQNQSRGM